MNTQLFAKPGHLRLMPPMHPAASDPCPSLRVPSTRPNRPWLRTLRAAEFEAWHEINQTALQQTPRASREFREHHVANDGRGQKEGRAMLVVAALAAAALAYALWTSLRWSVEWEQLFQDIGRLF